MGTPAVELARFPRIGVDFRRPLRGLQTTADNALQRAKTIFERIPSSPIAPIERVVAKGVTHTAEAITHKSHQPEPDRLASAVATYLELPTESPRKKVVNLHSTDRGPIVLSAEQLDHQTVEIFNFLRSRDDAITDATATPDGSVQKTYKQAA